MCHVIYVLSFFVTAEHSSSSFKFTLTHLSEFPVFLIYITENGYSPLRVAAA